MGLVVEFGRPLVRARRAKSDRPCEVTIFPGVRYERTAELPPTRPKADERRGQLALPLGGENG